MVEIRTQSAEQTEAAAAALAPALEAGDLLLLHGGLGAGKTAFVRGLVRGLGGDENEVSSPTFALMNRYEGRIPVFHFDLYRLGSEEGCEVAGSIFAGARAIDVTLQGEGDERTILLEGMHGTFDVGRLVQHGIRVRDEG